MKFASFHFFSALILSLIITHGPRSATGDDVGTNFFLKASKSVPRIGRRSMDFDNHFLKASKSVPRIGRRGFATPEESQDLKGYPIIRNPGSEVYLTETVGEPTWNDWEKPYDFYPRMQHLKEDTEDGNSLWRRRVKKDSELEEPRLQREIF